MRPCSHIVVVVVVVVVIAAVVTGRGCSTRDGFRATARAGAVTNLTPDPTTIVWETKTSGRIRHVCSWAHVIFHCPAWEFLCLRGVFFLLNYTIILCWTYTFLLLLFTNASTFSHPALSNVFGQNLFPRKSCPPLFGQFVLRPNRKV